jgi:UDP-N-acetylmuramyl-tripeptide synthetase
MLLSDLARRARLTQALRASERDPEIRTITFDSREAGPGALFVALRGARYDGHDFVEAAIEQGADALVVEDAAGIPEGFPVVVVDDSRARLAALADAFYDRPSLELAMCGITGTNGKTTCSFIVEAVVGEARSVGVIGTVNYRWPGRILPAPNTTPENLVTQRLLREMRDDGVESVVMEVSSHALATSRVEAVHFDVVLFTNFSQDHLDFHGTMEAYREAKLRLFGPVVERSLAVGKTPVAVVNLDDASGEIFAEHARKAGARVVTFGRARSADVVIEAVETDVSGTRFVTRSGDIENAWRTGLLGGFNVSNAVGAILCARALDVPDEAIARGLAGLDGVPGRLERVGGRFFVDYAHTPDALATVLATLREVVPDGGRIITLVGAGGDRDADKRPKMGAAAAEGSDVVVVTNDNPRTEDPASIAEAVAAGIPESTDMKIVLDRRAAISWAVDNAGEHDLVLVAGKGHETYQEVDGVRHPFNDVDELRRALEAT